MEEKKLGLELYRGTLVENQLKEYVKQTNHEIGELRAILANITNEIDRNTLLLRISEKKSVIWL